MANLNKETIHQLIAIQSIEIMKFCINMAHKDEFNENDLNRMQKMYDLAVKEQ